MKYLNSDVIELLNYQQKLIIESKEDLIIVEACPGAGKTYTVVNKIQKELNKKPINIETLNIRVDTARDLVFKVFNTTNSLLKTIVMLEETMVYGNRYRSYKEKVNEGLIMAEKLFFKGEYKKALEVTMNAIDYVEPGIHNRIMKAYNEN